MCENRFQCACPQTIHLLILADVTNTSHTKKITTFQSRICSFTFLWSAYNLYVMTLSIRTALTILHGRIAYGCWAGVTWKTDSRGKVTPPVSFQRAGESLFHVENWLPSLKTDSPKQATRGILTPVEYWLPLIIVLIKRLLDTKLNCT